MGMGMSEGGEASVGFETARARSWPTVTQFSVFLANKVGQLIDVVRHFQGSRVKIVGLSISDSADCCIIRLMLSHPEQGREILKRCDFPYCENELLVSELPKGPQSLMDLCQALLQAEINIHYAYPLIVHPLGAAALALHVDNNQLASEILENRGLTLISEADLIP